MPLKIILHAFIRLIGTFGTKSDSSYKFSATTLGYWSF